MFNPQSRKPTMKKFESYNDNGKDVNEISQKGVLASVWAHPAGMFLLLGVGTVTSLIAVGGLFKLLAWVRTEYNGFVSAGKGRTHSH